MSNMLIEVPQSGSEAIKQQPSPRLFGRILVAVASGKPALWAAELAGRLSAEGNRQVALLHVTDPRLLGTTVSELGLAVSHRYTEVLADGKVALDAALAHISAGTEVEQMIRDGETISTILDVAAQWKADVIVMGTHVHNRFTDLLLGSTAAAVVRQAPIPVLVVGHEPAARRD